MILLCLLWLCLLGCVSTHAQEPPSQTQVEAAILYQFANFVGWPSNANDAIIIGLVGSCIPDSIVQGTMANRVVNGRKIIITHPDPSIAKELKSCHILFICPDTREMLEILKTTKDAPVLTVSQTEHFLEDGGMINFVVEDGKIRFRIKEENTRRAGLKVSAKLLSLGRGR